MESRVLDKYMPNVSPCEPQTLKTSLCNMKLYSLTASDVQSDGDESGQCRSTTATTTRTVMTTTASDEEEQSADEEGSKLDIPAKFLSFAETEGSIGVAVSRFFLFTMQLNMKQIMQTTTNLKLCKLWENIILSTNVRTRHKNIETENFILLTSNG